MAGIVAGQSADGILWNSLVCSYALKCAVVISVRPPPSLLSQRSPLGSPYMETRCGWNSMPGALLLLKTLKLHPVKADKAIERGDPEETVGGLIDAANDVLRQAVVGCPNVVSVLGPSR